MQKLFFLAACAALFVVGCGGDAAEKTKKAAGDTGKAAKKAAGDTGKAVKEAASGDKDMDKSSSLGTEGYTPVSLNLPKMSWGACASSVRAALVKAGAKDIELDTDSKTGSFKCPKDMDVKAKLDELVADHSHLADYEINWAKTEETCSTHVEQD